VSDESKTEDSSSEKHPLGLKPGGFEASLRHDLSHALLQERMVGIFQTVLNVVSRRKSAEKQPQIPFRFAVGRLSTPFGQTRPNSAQDNNAS
jgi:hypothetical protein